MAYPILAEKSTWYTQGGTTINRNIFTQIDIVDSYTPTGQETESWDASAAKDESVMVYVNGTVLTIAGNGSGKISLSANSECLFYYDIYNGNVEKTKFSNVSVINGLSLFDTSNVTRLGYAFAFCGSITSLDLSSWNVDNVSWLRGTFRNCNKLATLNLDGWNVNPINMENTFTSCKALASLNISNWNVSQVNNFRNAFSSCESLTVLDLSGWDTSSATNMGYMFDGCTNLNTVNISSDWNTSNVTTMEAMFYKCSSLVSLDASNWNVSNVTRMDTMFYKCSSLVSLDASNWNACNLVDAPDMFNGCSNLASLEASNWNLCKLVTANQMFANCSTLTSLDVSNWDMGKVRNFQSMFNGCSSLTSLDVSKWNTSSATNMLGMFNHCTSLTNLDVSNWDVSKVTTFKAMFQGNGSYTTSMYLNLDVSKWDTSSATNMSFMFYGYGGSELDVSNWDVSKVTNFDHMFAFNRNVKVLDVSRWDTSSATNLYAIFHSVLVPVLNVSNFNTSQVTVFGQMFEACSSLKSIIGLENFDTSNGVCFDEMFQHCSNLKELNLSSFDTRKAKDGVTVSENGGKSFTLKNIFNGMNRLEKITLGENFSFNGDGTTTSNAGVLPTPNSEYIKHAIGSWYNDVDEAILPSDIPNKTVGTYYAIASKYRNLILVSSGSLEDIADSIRKKVGGLDKLYPVDMPEKINLMFDATTIITEITNDTLVLESKQEARLGEISTLILMMPTEVDLSYESEFSFTSGATPTTLTYSSTPITWRGDDCDADGEFVPETNTNYEIGVKCLSVSENGDVTVVARVGAY